MEEAMGWIVSLKGRSVESCLQDKAIRDKGEGGVCLIASMRTAQFHVL